MNTSASMAVTIGRAAADTGVSAKMIRHYESLGLLGGIARTDGGYRTYGASELHTLRFIRRARDLGFSIEEIRQLLSLWQDKQRASREVRQVATKHVAELEQRIAQLQAMRETLVTLMHGCTGDDRPSCPILNDLAGESCASREHHCH